MNTTPTTSDTQAYHQYLTLLAELQAAPTQAAADTDQLTRDARHQVTALESQHRQLTETFRTLETELARIKLPIATLAATVGLPHPQPATTPEQLASTQPGDVDAPHTVNDAQYLLQAISRDLTSTQQAWRWVETARQQEANQPLPVPPTPPPAPLPAPHTRPQSRRLAAAAVAAAVAVLVVAVVAYLLLAR